MNRKVLIIGASSGIGKYTVEAFEDQGDCVFKTRRSIAKIDGFNNDQSWYELDLSKKDSIDNFIVKIQNKISEIECIIFNAGHDQGGRKKFHLGSLNDWENILQSNIVGYLRLLHGLLPELLKKENIDLVFVNTSLYFHPREQMAAYQASKFALAGLVESLRLDYAESSLRIGSIYPGLTKTQLQNRRYNGDASMVNDFFNKFKFVLDPKDVATSILFMVNQPKHIQIPQLEIVPRGHI